MTEGFDYAIIGSRPWDVQRRIAAHAGTTELIGALRLSSHNGARRLLCYTLGHREDAQAVPALIECLTDGEMRWSAADALAHIGDARAGEPLFQIYSEQHDAQSKVIYVIGLGAGCYRPAIPSLMADLDSPEPLLRSYAAWALGQMRAKEAERVLVGAIEREVEGYDREVMKQALANMRL